MMKLKWKNPKYAPYYATGLSAGADVKSTIDCVINPGEVAIIPTGVWIDQTVINKWYEYPIPELQLRLRSSLSAKYGLVMPNGIGTIDADYEDEIKVMIYNPTKKAHAIVEGDRIAQLVLNFVHHIRDLNVGGPRRGGFGSTGKN